MRLRVGVCSVRTTPLDFDGHRHRLVRAFAQSRQLGIQILALPELVLSGYECGDFFWHPWVSEKAWQTLLLLLPETKGLITAVGLPLRIQDRLYNAAALIADGQLLGFALKTELPKDGVFYEPRWFVPGPKQDLLTEPRTGLPAGPLTLSWEGLAIAVEICEEAWRPSRTLDRLAPHIVLSLNASPFEIGKPARRRRLVSESSYRYRCAYLYANLLGNEAGKLLYDGESLIAFQGDIWSHTPPFSLAEYEITAADLDLMPVLTSRLRGGFPQADPTTRTVPPIRERPASAPLATSKLSPLLSDEAAITQAISMGLWDYLYKTQHKGFVVSLSGGLDSAACAVFAHIALQRAFTELPPEIRAAYLSYLSSDGDLRVHTFYQATAQSSDATFQRAQKLAHSLGLPFTCWDIQPIVEAYEALITTWLGRIPSWDRDDSARQNLQARVRVPGLWMAANILGALYLTTGNRSEISVGYTTMDGDAAGGLAPIAGLSKPFLQKWAFWAADTYHWPVLGEIAQAAPTAELRPGFQTDEEDLMPYPLLNFFEEKLLWEGLPPEAIAPLSQSAFQALTSQALQAYAQQYIHLFRVSQWKRERLAPGFHTDKYDLDPRSAARFPILHALSPLT